ncbi:L,D-transpeptidase family protein [Marinicella meishanensis]|uniref:L,D-transpeptidase family protein n=1 Tax=Marinicella meishanensis TaxID=2873263 RepID=UPI001CBAD8EB|nr:murein L,D-transpeptidase family protein [Marinicella sp. NBU2979]
MLFKTALLLLASLMPIPQSQRASQAIQNNQPLLQAAFHQRQLTWGSPVHLRLYKDSAELELWVQNGPQFTLFKTYPICTFSGALGPKLREGDWQSPEGFYFVKPGQLNPRSRFHLSFNLGFPNAYDRHHGRTGSALMVHGDCVSIGCYAMTDPQIEEIYTLMVVAFEHGQPFVRVHAFPFRMDEANMQAHAGHRWIDYWRNLKVGHDFFIEHGRPPNVEVMDGRYVFD